MKVGDLVRLQFQGNGHPGIGIIYDAEEMIGPQGDFKMYACLWDNSMWNHTQYQERELVVVNESR
jgi:hypothetical protein